MACPIVSALTIAPAVSVDEGCNWPNWDNHAGSIAPGFLLAPVAVPAPAVPFELARLAFQMIVRRHQWPCASDAFRRFAIEARSRKYLSLTNESIGCMLWTLRSFFLFVATCSLAMIFVTPATKRTQPMRFCRRAYLRPAGCKRHGPRADTQKGDAGLTSKHVDASPQAVR